MNTPERKFYESFKSAKPTWFWQRLEDSISSGIPDTLVIPVCSPPSESEAVLIEFKALPSTNVQLRKSQVAWITEFSRKGGAVWVFNKCPKTGSIQGYKAPFPITVGRKDHGKITGEPTLIVTDLKNLKGSHLTNPTRRLV